MDHLVGRHFTLDGIEKADEFLVEVALHAARDDLALNAAGGFPALRSRTRPHAFTHDGPRPSRVRRTSPKYPQRCESGTVSLTCGEQNEPTPGARSRGRDRILPLDRRLGLPAIVSVATRVVGPVSEARPPFHRAVTRPPYKAVALLRDRSFPDSPLEEEGFEPVVPLQRGQPCAELGPSFFGTRLRPPRSFF